MAKFFKFKREISEGIVRDIIPFKFNNGEMVFINDEIVMVNSTDQMISEWLSEQNCNPIELTIEESTKVSMEWAKIHGEEYNGFMVPFTNEDALGLLQVKAVFEMGISSTNIEFSNGTIMPISATDFPPFAAWFVTKRNGYFV